MLWARHWLRRRRSLLRSYRVQLLLVSVCAAAIGTLILTLVAYQTARRSIEANALHTVSIAASAREQSLLLHLRQQKDRADAFLEGLQTHCLADGLDEQSRSCIRTSMEAWAAAEKAVAARLTVGGVAFVA